MELASRDIPEQSITFLSREEPKNYPVRKTAESDLDSIKTPPAESSGSGKSSGAVLGGVIGGTAGFYRRSHSGLRDDPGTRPYFRHWLGAAALLGVGGAAAGAKAGQTEESEVDKGASQAQIQFYHQLLQRGYSLVLANVRSGSDTSTVREVFEKYHTEDVETVRRELGLAA